MGIIRMGPPDELVRELKDTYAIDFFVETGTFHGDTARWASKFFKRVITIEGSKEIYEETVRKYGDLKNIEFLCGDTGEKLSEVVSALDSPAVFWLDAHWSGGLTYGRDNECPLIDEIRILNGSKSENFIFIDDARLFMSSPSPPHRAEQWPDIASVIGALNKRDCYVAIIEDCIIAFPAFAKSLLVDYCQRVNLIEWRRSSGAKELQGLKMVFDGIKNRIGTLCLKK